MIHPVGQSPCVVLRGRGTHLPNDVLTNADVAMLAEPGRLAEFVRANVWCQQRAQELGAESSLGHDPIAGTRRLFAEFIEKRVGIRERRVIDRSAIVQGRPGRRDLWGSDLGAQAASNALADAGVDPREVDLIVCGTSTPDSLCPSTAMEIQHALGASSAIAFDVMAACTSFAYALSTAHAMVRSGSSRCALVVAAEYFSCIIDWANPATSYFAGDGAAAVVLQRHDADREEGTGSRPGMRLIDQAGLSHYSACIRTGGIGGTRAYLATLAGESSPESVPGEDGYRFFHQEGPRVYREVLPKVENVVRRMLERNGLEPEGVARWWVHQASLPMLDGLFDRLLGGRPPDAVAPTVLDRMGNTSSCGAAYVLAEDRGLAPGEHGVLLAFGGGYTIGAVLLAGP